ncbi:DUF2520 domain-containing protein [Wenzhouxiangella sp. AB-CW3]|uniref:Rossmann-like and DUF2520 domain-containing protein n=1 Tax=Wenzhouxiangella sp. AB-CW3 TaxID=2771012 RepID=UPI00168BB9AE|nr:Rossmann-like and DUF2520 domain-containing protein [Wenzhouxiangella sp. AB-CW3]QOC21144.1 DUF2520 domain-containing protein [Wenzhouxiangella sp. AB-CW3]
MTRARLHVLGCGRTARVLAHLMHQGGLVDIGCVVNRSLESAQEAVTFIGAGRAAEQLPPDISSDWLLLGLPDGVIEQTAERAASKLTGQPELVFHLSGSVSSSALVSLGGKHAAVHPLRAFANPEHAVAHFDNTWCLGEGDAGALKSLGPVFEKCGARFSTFAPANKAAWHAATVAASNFLVVINGLARELAVAAGVDEEDAKNMLADLQFGTLTALADRPAATALTGPYERGDSEAIERLHEAVAHVLDKPQADLYNALARGAVRLARIKRGPVEGDETVISLTSRSG